MAVLRPSLNETARQRHVDELMSARQEVKAVTATGNAQQLNAARTRIQEVPLTVFAQSQLIASPANSPHPLRWQGIRRTKKSRIGDQPIGSTLRASA